MLMLSELRVENLLLIERAELRLAPGLNVLTGETGAGKTVLAHALDLLAEGVVELDYLGGAALEDRVPELADERHRRAAAGDGLGVESGRGVLVLLLDFEVFVLMRHCWSV